MNRDKGLSFKVGDCIIKVNQVLSFKKFKNLYFREWSIQDIEILTYHF